MRRRRHVKRTPNTAPPLEKKVEREIINAAEDMGFDVTKFSQPRNTMQTPDIPDLYFQHKAKRFRCWCEVKREREKPTATQNEWHAKERRAGGIVLIARSVGDLVDQLNEHGFPVKPQ